MPKKPRIDKGGLVYHVCNRANLRARILFETADYRTLERAMVQAIHAVPIRILSFCLMPNHWHFVVWTANDGDLAAFFGRLALIHTQRWHARRQTTGTGHLYQGRFRSFVIQSNERLLDVCRYVERNALEAKLVTRAEGWRYGSAFHRQRRTKLAGWLWNEWPAPRPADWLGYVNEEANPSVRAVIRKCTQLGKPYGDEAWQRERAREFGVEWRERGRPSHDGVQLLDRK